MFILRLFFTQSEAEAVAATFRAVMRAVIYFLDLDDK